MNNWQEIIKEAIKNALTRNTRESKIKPVYAFTNENIHAYLKEVEGKKALSICSSGDHYLNLIAHDFTLIDLVDTNPLTEYYALGIKVALIQGFSYESFPKIITFLYKNKHNDQETEDKILSYLLKYMPPKYCFFWQEIFSYYSLMQSEYHRDITLFQILTQDYYFDLDEITFYNTYMQNKEIYNKTKERLTEGKTSFTKKNILEFEKNLLYDIILCSNILEHTYYPNGDMTKLKIVYQTLKKELNKNGKLYASYLYNLYQNGTMRNYPIGGFDITQRELLKEEVLIIPSYHQTNKHGVLVLKKDK